MHIIIYIYIYIHKQGIYIYVYKNTCIHTQMDGQVADDVYD